MKREYYLIKQDIISFEDWKSGNNLKEIIKDFDPGERPFIGATNYTYEAYPSKLKVINESTKKVTTFNGRFCSKRVMFKIDNKNEMITIEGIVKPPKNPLKKLFWDKGFTGVRRVNSINEVIHSDIRYHEYIRINKKLVETSLLPEVSKNDIVLAFDTESHSWYASEDLTLEEAKPVLDEFKDHKV